MGETNRQELRNCVQRLHAFLQQRGRELNVRISRGPCRPDNFDFDEDILILAYFMDEDVFGKKATEAVYLRLQARHFLCLRTVRELRSRSQKLCRKIHEVEAWRAFSTQPDALTVPILGDEADHFRRTMLVLRRNILYVGDPSRPRDNE